MPRLPAALLASLVLVSSACYSPHSVTGPQGELDGIPFFVKVPQYTQTTEYEARWLEVGLRLKRGANDPSVELLRRVPVSERSQVNELAVAIKTASTRSQEDQETAWTKLDSDVRALMPNDSERAEKIESYQADALRAQDAAAGTAWDEVRMKFEALTAIPDLEQALEQASSSLVPKHVVGNRVDYSPYIDYSKRYTYNVALPFFSKVDSTVKLNADLLLTDATANVDLSGSATGLASLLPIKEFLSEKLLDTAAVAGMAALDGMPPTPELTVELSVAEKGVRFAFTRRAPCASCLTGTLPFDLTANFTRQPLEGAPKKEPEDPGAKKAGFALSGEVKLPK